MTTEQAKNKVAQQEYGCSWRYMLTFMNNREILNGIINKAMELYAEAKAKQGAKA